MAPGMTVRTDVRAASCYHDCFRSEKFFTHDQAGEANHLYAGAQASSVLVLVPGQGHWTPYYYTGLVVTCLG